MPNRERHASRKHLFEFQHSVNPDHPAGFRCRIRVRSFDDGARRGVAVDGCADRDPARCVFGRVERPADLFVADDLNLADRDVLRVGPRRTARTEWQTECGLVQLDHVRTGGDPLDREHPELVDGARFDPVASAGVRALCAALGIDERSQTVECRAALPPNPCRRACLTVAARSGRGSSRPRLLPSHPHGPTRVRYALARRKSWQESRSRPSGPRRRIPLRRSCSRTRTSRIRCLGPEKKSVGSYNGQVGWMRTRVPVAGVPFAWTTCTEISAPRVSSTATSRDSPGSRAPSDASAAE